MRRRIPQPPATGNAQLDAWARSVTDALSGIPFFSVISSANGPNSSGLTGDPGGFVVDIGSAVTKFWQKRSLSTSTTGWSAFSWI